MKTIGIADFKKLVMERLANPRDYADRSLVLWNADYNEYGIAYRVIKQCCKIYNKENPNDQVWFKDSDMCFASDDYTKPTCMHEEYVKNENGDGYEDASSFNVTLSSEEINILAILMMISWVQRQVTSIENTRMKYSGSDFKMTSQANHLSKLLALLTESRRDSFHMQRLYKRRKFAADGKYASNWGSLMERSALDY